MSHVLFEMPWLFLSPSNIGQASGRQEQGAQMTSGCASCWFPAFHIWRDHWRSSWSVKEHDALNLSGSQRFKEPQGAQKEPPPKTKWNREPQSSPGRTGPKKASPISLQNAGWCQGHWSCYTKTDLTKATLQLSSSQL